jgi:DNA-binding transcriptional regulator LsrR (DeoR family)
VQILGGLGSPGAPMHATNLTRRLANLLSAEVTMLPAPGVVGSASARKVLLAESYVQDAIRCFPSVTTALVGIGAVEPSKMLASSGNVFSPQALQSLEEHGAVGDICMRFFNQHGHPVRTALDDRVISMELEQLRGVPRVVAVAGGPRKTAAIRGALVGRWANVLITDHETAIRLLELGPALPDERSSLGEPVPTRKRGTTAKQGASRKPKTLQTQKT